MKGFIEEFKSFATKGNVIDLAVAVVIGAAFGKIVSSLVDNIITPLIGVLLGGVNLTSYAWHIGDASVTYGVFLQSVIDFLIIALVIFLIVKAINKAERFMDGPDEPKETKPAEPTEEVTLLREIRDSLRRG